jgi:hypothetical protein
MPHLDKTGPEGNGNETGRQFGDCKDQPTGKLLQLLGKGMGKRRKSGGGTGKGRRLKSKDV